MSQTCCVALEFSRSKWLIAWRLVTEGARRGEHPVVQVWHGEAGFEMFLTSVGKRLSAEHRLVRTDPRRAFGPSNAGWVAGTPRRDIPRHLIVHRGRTITLRATAGEAGIRYATLQSHLRRGWSIERTLGRVS